MRTEIVTFRAKFRVKIDGAWLVNLGDGKPRTFSTREAAATAAKWAAQEVSQTSAVYTGPRI